MPAGTCFQAPLSSMALQGDLNTESCRTFTLQWLQTESRVCIARIIPSNDRAQGWDVWGFDRAALPLSFTLSHGQFLCQWSPRFRACGQQREREPVRDRQQCLELGKHLRLMFVAKNDQLKSSREKPSSKPAYESQDWKTIAQTTSNNFRGILTVMI